MALTNDTPLTKMFTPNEGLITTTSEDQEEVEEVIADILADFKHGGNVIREEGPLLQREDHVAYLQRGLEGFSRGYAVLDASRPWLVYWTIHSLELLDAPIGPQHQQSCIELLKRCQSRTGGFGGGPGQLPHLAPTYASVNSLATIGTPEALALIDRPRLYTWLMQMKKPDGAFTMHQDGENDVRGAYCAVSIATLCNIVTPELFEGTADWIARCQTYEGGIAAEPGDEAHGGYAFCGLAALAMLNSASKLDLGRMLHWTSHRQMSLEGGFQGRSNKLVDGCYSFWVGGVFPLLHDALAEAGQGGGVADAAAATGGEEEDGGGGSFLYSQAGLQDYILYCCQIEGGGLRDKPGKGRDYYHTCYCLSGLASSQHNPDGEAPTSGSIDDAIQQIHPHHNISMRKYAVASVYFQSQPPVES